MGYAVVSLTMGFRAGPQNQTFYACEEHRQELLEGNHHSGLFFFLKTEVPQAVDPDDEAACDLCREG